MNFFYELSNPCLRLITFQALGDIKDTEIAKPNKTYMVYKK